MTTLFIGNKNYSSWSMRAWLALRWGQVPFEEQLIQLGGEGFGKSKIPEVLAASPSGRVPALKVGEITIWESSAICEWAAEQNSNLWPKQSARRALARAAASEMHGGYFALRQHVPMNVRRRVGPQPWSDETLADIARVQELWAGLRAQFGSDGPYLFGPRCIADAMFAPVCTRFRTYAVSIGAEAQGYCDTIFSDPEFKRWEAGAIAEPYEIAETDDLYDN